MGPHVDQFENEMADYIGMDFAAALSSGTAALHLALKIIGVKSGDYVFCSDLTFVATVNAIKYLDANPIFIDSEESSWNMCPKSLEMAFMKHRPKAIIVTDLYGQSADYNSISEIYISGLYFSKSNDFKISWSCPSQSVTKTTL